VSQAQLPPYRGREQKNTQAILFCGCHASHFGVVHDNGWALLGRDLHVLELDTLGVLDLQASGGGRESGMNGYVFNGPEA